jgi:nitroimidazol reductase NimA-like FMN-containing flavoprotein (pyridoxamine 5'-phosphate oxidase superfamily)
MMLKEMKALVKDKNICVLATVAGGKPHCSLMAYVTDENCEEIHMVTLRNTRKYRNLKENPAVSLLIDNREKSPHSEAKALTVEGVYTKVESTQKAKKVQENLLAVHPHLTDLMNHPDAEILCIQIHSFLMLKGLEDAHFESIRD